jgi:hypothetical protein
MMMKASQTFLAGADGHNQKPANWGANQKLDNSLHAKNREADLHGPPASLRDMDGRPNGQLVRSSGVFTGTSSLQSQLPT